MSPEASSAAPELTEEARGTAPGRGRLDGRRVLVIGGGQNDYGIEDPPVGNGRAMSTLFAREGAALAVADLDEDSAKATAALVRDEGATAEILVGDGTDEDAVRRMVADAAEALGGLDGLVLNIGSGAGFHLSGTSAEDWDNTMATNLRSAFLGCKHGLAAMDSGAIVLIGSVAAQEVLPIPAYGASKAGLESLCRQAAIEGAPQVRTNLLMPGLIDTPLGRMASQVSSKRDEVRIPAGRQGTAWEVAYAALFMLSGESSYLTGQSIILDGGLTVAPRA